MMERLYGLFAVLTTPKTDEKGASMVEYALLVALIAIVVAAAAAFLGNAISNLFNDAGNSL